MSLAAGTLPPPLIAPARDRCAWRSYGSFRAYTWGSVIAANLVMLARRALA
jgi:hypothetical protein